MHISLLTCGTRGDTQPMVVLGAELRRRGHQVRIVASPNTLDLPRSCGFEALPLGPDSQALMESEDGRRWLAAGNVRAFTTALTEISHQTFDASVEQTMSTCADADLVVAGILAEDLAGSVAELTGTPFVTLHSAPVRRTSAYPHPLVTSRQLPRPANALTGAVFERVWWRGMRADIEGFRESVGLPPAGASVARRQRAVGGLELQAYDPALVPGLGWDDRRPLIGFLTLDDDLRSALGESGLDPAVDAWLDAGDPPVFFGFGSMPVRDPRAAVETITTAARAVGVRALVSAGWGRLAEVDPDDLDVRVVGGVDHDAVLPRCQAAVHHGGAGTTAASLGAGLPTVVCSVFADQHFWGARVADRRAGAALRFRELDAGTLETALRAALTDGVRERAAHLGTRLRSGRGAAERAADALESTVAVG